MKIELLADPEIPVVSTSMTVAQGLASLDAQRYPYAFVVSAGRPIGWFSKDDAQRRLGAGADAETTTVGELMRWNVNWFYSDWDSAEVASAMVEKGIDHAVIRDRNGDILGFVEAANLIRSRSRSIPFPRFARPRGFALAGAR